MTRDRHLTRRTALRTLAGVGALGAAGLGSRLATPAEAAHIASTIDIGGPVVVSTDTGDLSFVEVGVAVDITWDGFEEEVHYLQFLEYLDAEQGGSFLIGGTGPKDGHQFYKSGIVSLSDHAASSSLNDASDPGTEGFIHAEVQLGGSPFVLLADAGEGKDNPWHSPGPYTGPNGELAEFEPASDGETLVTTLTFNKNVRLFDANKDPLTGQNSPAWGPDDPLAADDFDVEVTNEASSTGTSGTGSSSGG